MKMEYVVMSSRGQSVAEYGLVAALVAVVSLAGLQMLGNSLFTQMSDFAGALSRTAANGSGSNVAIAMPMPVPQGNNLPLISTFQGTQGGASRQSSSTRRLSSTSTTRTSTKKSRTSSAPSSSQTSQGSTRGCGSAGQPSCAGGSQY